MTYLGHGECGLDGFRLGNQKFLPCAVVSKPSCCLHLSLLNIQVPGTGPQAGVGSCSTPRGSVLPVSFLPIPLPSPMEHQGLNRGPGTY